VRESLSERLSGLGYSVTADFLTNDFYDIFKTEFITKDKIKSTVEKLFRNRLLRKNVISKDAESSIDSLSDDDYLYLSAKGYCMLDLFSDSSALLEIYREDIRRAYDNADYYYPSYTLIKNNKYSILYEDMINLCKEIYDNENEIFSHMRNVPFKRKGLNLTSKIIDGIQKSLNKQIDSLSHNTRPENLNNIISDIKNLKEEINKRITELQK
jgi:hypothetical protein